MWLLQLLAGVLLIAGTGIVLLLLHQLDRIGAAEFEDALEEPARRVPVRIRPAKPAPAAPATDLPRAA